MALPSLSVGPSPRGMGKAGKAAWRESAPVRDDLVRLTAFTARWRIGMVIRDRVPVAREVRRRRPVAPPYRGGRLNEDCLAPMLELDLRLGR